jgi:hypothetical protein
MMCREPKFGTRVNHNYFIVMGIPEVSTLFASPPTLQNWPDPHPRGRQRPNPMRGDAAGG